eukprot:1031353-Prymnesium_polylepis.1
MPAGDVHTRRACLNRDQHRLVIDRGAEGCAGAAYDPHLQGVAYPQQRITSAGGFEDYCTVAIGWHWLRTSLATVRLLNEATPGSMACSQFSSVTRAGRPMASTLTR